MQVRQSLLGRPPPLSTHTHICRLSLTKKSSTLLVCRAFRIIDGGKRIGFQDLLVDLKSREGGRGVTKEELYVAKVHGCQKWKSLKGVKKEWDERDDSKNMERIF